MNKYPYTYFFYMCDNCDNECQLGINMDIENTNPEFNKYFVCPRIDSKGQPGHSYWHFVRKEVQMR